MNRLAWQVYEMCSDEREIVIAGIAENGFRLAKQIAVILSGISPIKTQVIEIRINKEQPLETPQVSVELKSLEGKTVIVVDDVSNSGRTLMYGVKYFLEFPVRAIHTLVLVDRDHNRYPIKANFVGLSLATTLQEHITVELGAGDEAAVYLD